VPLKNLALFTRNQGSRVQGFVTQ
jgi:hypothetical protein